MFRVIIAGSRSFQDYELLEKTMDNLLVNQKEVAVVCGMARGADSLGEAYAKVRGYPIHYFPADWEKYGKSAGYKRNEQMAQNADALVAFWDGESRGTKHMIDIANRYNLKVRITRYRQNKSVKE